MSVVRLTQYDANRAVIARWERLVELAKLGLLAPSTTAFVLSQTKGGA